ncbi:hypothetical protein SK803_30495 [Lentzea sp. BCCO 10_0856]|uniref:Lipoprotein n=1 Tax=Lentzea miocenica TaxID=3095431 RepID=A0ABU4T8S8_9PSEU|nr:hypothetical protein [Lentzea sp. BCCO 10_0856]MDX8034571.1 hypothetical protein [Lentzea sp. BCCO 10_0856]
MRRLALLALLLFLTACGTSDDTVEDLSDRIESDLKALDAVSAVEVEYTTGMDYRQYLKVRATVPDRAKADEAMKILRRDYWTGTGRRVDFRVTFSSPSGAEVLTSDDIKFKLGDVVEMEREHGPRSTAGELEPGR